MYLRGLSAGLAVPGAAPASTFQSGSQTIPNMTESACSSQGGSWRTYNPNNITFNSPGNCVLPVYSALPSAPPPAPQISVSVPTNVNTQVSPQVSPNFIQQDHPTGSPVNASTSSQPSQSSAPDNSAYLKQLADQQKAFMDEMAQMQAERDAQSQAAQTPAPNPSPAQQVPPPVAQTIMIPSSPAPDMSSSTPQPVATQVTGFAQYEHYWPYALAALIAVGALVALDKKNKRKGK